MAGYNWKRATKWRESPSGNQGRKTIGFGGLLLVALVFLTSGCVGIVYDSNAFHGGPVPQNAPKAIWIDEIIMPNQYRSSLNSTAMYRNEAIELARQRFPNLYRDETDAVRIRARLTDSNRRYHWAGSIFGFLIYMGSLGVLPAYEGETRTDFWRVDFLDPETGTIVHRVDLQCAGEHASFLSVFFPSAWIIAAASSPHTDTFSALGSGNENKADLRHRMDALVWGIAREVAYHHESTSTGGGQ
ncbi:MAG: hypothetical protein JJU11_06450 [Candidatus Sumerlaeia bacterium]|nr:hypothetical protein [Candidatus Sumerlaeia bacterium]